MTLLVILAIVFLLLLFGGVFLVKWLFIAAIIVALIWIISFFANRSSV